MIKSFVATLLGVFFIAGLVMPQTVSGQEGGKFSGCTKIKDGVLTYSAGHYLGGQPLRPGYDPYGYNYQAHMFNGSYANAYLGGYGYPPYEGDDDAYLAENPGAENTWVWESRNVMLIMWWSDIWLSNKDCNGDGKLDRGYICDPVNASSSGCLGAWLTNHQWGSYEGEEGATCNWNYFVKIVAVPGDAYTDNGNWYTADGVLIGPVIWGAFAIVMQVENDPCSGLHGVSYLSPFSAGFGKYGPQRP